MYVCVYVYVYKYTYTLYPLVPLICTHTRTRTVCEKQRNILDLRKKRKKKRRGTEKMELAWRDVGSCKRARLHFPNFRKEILHSRARLSHETRGAYILFWRILHFARATTDAYRLLHRHTHTRRTPAHTFTCLRRDDSETVHRRAITRACKSRNYNASRGENARVIRLIFRF